MWEVKMCKDDWDKLQEELEEYHKNEIENIKNAIHGIRNMIQSDNCFSVGRTNDNLVLLVDTIETKVVPLIENVFLDTEQSVHTFVVGNNNIDTIC